MTTSMTDRLDVEIVSDVVCPFCFIGARRLAQALAATPDLTAEVVYRPFLLSPSVPPEGQDLRDHLKRKYGNPEPMFRRVEAVAREVGIAMDFGKVRRMSSTVRAHTLLRLALSRGTQAVLANDLFEAYFVEGRDIGAMDVLVELGLRHGFTEKGVIDLMERPAELAETRREAEEAAAAGVTAVPFFVLGKRFAVQGAQPLDVFVRAIAEARRVGPEGE
jgi:predicted DsbA family dithiol-disulfide isomerase